MEAADEAIARPRYNNDIFPIGKGKRTKRHRPNSPIPFTLMTTPTTVAREYGTATNNHRLSPSFSALSSEESTTTEEEDTARCLILLSHGHFSIQYPPNTEANDHNLQQYDFKQNNIRNEHEQTAAKTTTVKGGGTCLYACKTCDRVFPSFQALGGHRASHKKPKNEKKSAIFSDEEDFPSPSMLPSEKRMTPTSLSLQLSNISTAAATAVKPFPSPRIHECSYCGAEFTSGQALGGHMRRHRPGPISPSLNPAAASIEEPEPGPEEQKVPRNGLSLDLNLPAPEDENKRLGFASRQQNLVDYHC